MKGFILIFSLFSMVHVLAQSAGNKYTFQEIGWSIILPADFKVFPSADESIQIQPGKRTDNESLSKRLITAMKDADFFGVGLTSCDSRYEDAGDIFSASNKRGYAIASKEEGIQCDSATTTVSIDGVFFKRFRMTTRRNNLIQQNFVSMYTCYKGYAIYITLLYASKKTGHELESMLAYSKFSK